MGCFSSKNGHINKEEHGFEKTLELCMSTRKKNLLLSEEKILKSNPDAKPFIVYISRNGMNSSIYWNTLGAVYYTIEDCMDSIDHCKDAIRVDKNPNKWMQEIAVDGRDTILIKKLLRYTWDRYPNEWTDFLNDMENRISQEK